MYCVENLGVPSPILDAIRPTNKNKEWYIKESGRIRRRIGRIWHIIIDDLYTFSNAICLIVFLIVGKWVNFTLNVFLFLQNMILNRATRTNSYENRWFNFLKKLVVSGSSLHESEMCYWCVFHERIYCINEKMERWPRDNQKVIFLFYSWVENMLSPYIRDCSLNNTLNMILKFAVWLSGIVSAFWKPLIGGFGSNTANSFFFIFFFLHFMVF